MRVAWIFAARSMDSAGTPVISETFSGVYSATRAVKYSHTGLTLDLRPSFSSTSNSPYSAGSMAGSNGVGSGTQPWLTPGTRCSCMPSWPAVGLLHVSPSHRPLSASK